MYSSLQQIQFNVKKFGTNGVVVKRAHCTQSISITNTENKNKRAVDKFLDLLPE